MITFLASAKSYAFNSRARRVFSQKKQHSSIIVCASSEDFGKTAPMRKLAFDFFVLKNNIFSNKLTPKT